ncbi:hypothetical protein [Rhodococcus koreensis]|uniref:hypothetical protein n=1 Tax=Rhodococcus koreensis TaxID=99653 RepID=UPI0036D9A3D9
MEWFVSFCDRETQRTSVRAGEAPDRGDALTQIVSAGRELARREDGSVVNEVAHLRVGDDLAVVGGFDSPSLSDEVLRSRIEAAIAAKKEHACTVQQQASIE